jgi:hypothetical protein
MSWTFIAIAGMTLVGRGRRSRCQRARSDDGTAIAKRTPRRDDRMRRPPTGGAIDRGDRHDADAAGRARRGSSDGQTRKEPEADLREEGSGLAPHLPADPIRMDQGERPGIRRLSDDLDRLERVGIAGKDPECDELVVQDARRAHQAEAWEIVARDSPGRYEPPRMSRVPLGCSGRSPERTRPLPRHRRRSAMRPRMPTARPRRRGAPRGRTLPCRPPNTRPARSRDRERAPASPRPSIDYHHSRATRICA